MTMLVRSLAGLAGVAALFAGAQVASAGDVIPLKSSGSVNAPAITLGYDGNSETELARYARGGFYGGGFRGGFYGGGGYRGGFVAFGGYRGGFYGGYRGGYYGGYRGGYYGGYYGGYRPYYANYYRPYYYGGYYQPYYYGTSYYSTPYYAPSYYSAPCDYGYSSTYLPVTQVGVVQQSTYSIQQPYLPSVTPYGATYNAPYAVPQQGISGYNGNLPVMPPVQPNNGTYPYDGGPVVPVPMPKQDLNPAKSTPHAPNTLRLVNLSNQPAQQSSQFSFPAYGEDTRASGFAIDRTTPAKKTNR